MTTASLAASDRGAAVRIDRLFLGLALGATAILVALVLLDHQPASAALILGGFGLGIAFLKAEFSYTASWRRFLTRGDASGLVGGLIVIVICALVVVPVAALSPKYGGAIAPLGPSLVLGAFVFGVGMLCRGFRDARRRIEGCRHTPGTWIGLRETDEVGAFCLGAGNEVHRVADILLSLLDRIGDRLHNGNAECHVDLFHVVHGFGHRAALVDEADDQCARRDLLATEVHADARRKAEAVLQEKMKAVTGGLPLPPGLTLG